MSWAFKPGMFTLVVACIIGGQSRLTQAAQPTPGSEQPDAQARARVLAVEGIEFLEQERWVEAQARLSQAYALFQAPTVAVLEARALEQLGRLNEAYARYRQASELPINRASPKAFRRAVAQAQQEQTRLDSIIPTLAVRLSAPGSEQTIQVNGKPLRKAEWGKPQRLDPGAYTIEALDGERVQTSERVELESGTTTVLVLRVERAPTTSGVAKEPLTSPPPSHSQPLAWASLGIGSAGLATGIASGLVMLRAKSELDQDCSPDCPASSRSALKRFRRARAISISGYSAGAVGLGLGLWLLLDATESETPASGSVQLSRGGGQVEFWGAF